MANKRVKEERARENERAKRQTLIVNARRKFQPFALSAAIVSLVIMLLFFVDWAAVYNTDIRGNEVKISGFNTVFAAISGGYTKADKIYGNMAAPFFYYAADWCKAIGVLTVAAFFVNILCLAASLTAYFTEYKRISALTLGCAAVLFALLLAIFFIALSMKDSRILPVYCGGNPKCSIRSAALLPAVVSAGCFALSLIGWIKYEKAMKKL